MLKKVDKLLIIIAITVVIIGIIAILIGITNVEINTKKSEKMNTNYSTIESNTWDVSKAGDGSIIAKLSEDGTLTISGIGEMKDWKSNDTTDWRGMKDTVKSVIIEDGVTSIGKYAFHRCTSLTSIEIPKSVTSIGSDAIRYCTSLINIEVDENNTVYKDENGVLYSKDGTKIIIYPSGKKETNYNVLNGVITIEWMAFYECTNLINIEVPNSVTRIRDYAFKGCTSLTNIEIPNSVTSIGTYAFCDCTSLTNIEIPNGVTSIGGSTFQQCTNLTNINIPSSVTSIGDWAFWGCTNLTNIQIPNSVTSIGNVAFYCCESLTDIEIPSSVTSIGDEAFDRCKITKFINSQNNTMELPDLLKRAKDETDILYSSQEFTLTNCIIQEQQIIINEDSIYGIIKINDGKLSGLTYMISYNIWDISEAGNGSLTATLNGNGILKIIGTGNMQDWDNNANTAPWYSVKEQIKSVEFSGNVTNIGRYAFYNCKSLTEIEIPNSVISIEGGAFYFCSNLANIKISSSVTSIGWDVFHGCISLTKIEIPSSLTSIGSMAFYDCKNLINIEVDENNTVYKDENGVLYSKEGTKLIIYPLGKKETEYKILNGVISIEDRAFYNCTSLTKIEIPNSVTNIGSYTFDGCESLTNIEIPNGVTNIELYTFYNCKSLTNIEIPSSVTSISTWAFYGCKSLTNIQIPSSVTSIEGNVFYRCENLTNIEVDENNTVYKDENGVLYSKDGTKFIIYPSGKKETKYNILNSVTSIEEDAFYICDSLRSIVVPSSVINIGDNAFYKSSNLTIICRSGSVAETYVVEKGIQHIIDDISPTLTLSGDATVDTIILNSEATDEISGVDENSYKYKIKKENETYAEVIAGDISHTFTDLKSNTKYIIQVQVSDYLGNTASKEIEVITLKSNKVTTLVYDVDEEKLIIKGIKPKTTVEQLKSNLQSDMSYQIIDQTGQVILSTSNVGTGYKIKLEDGKMYTLIITGDINGDGKAKLSDLSKLKLTIVGTTQLEGAYKEAADLNGDGNIKLSDLSKMKLYLVGKGSL